MIKKHLVLTLVFCLALGNLANLNAVAADVYQPRGQAPASDYGDAPDGSLAGDAEPFDKVIGRFPTRFNTTNSRLGLPGAHALTTGQETLGTNVSAELDATDRADPDGTVNLVDEDRFDDSLRVGFAEMDPDQPETINIIAGVVQSAPHVARYVNVLIDLNHDGVWQRVDDKEEWIVKNRPIPIAPGSSAVAVQVPFLLVKEASPTWMRVALTRTPIPEANFAAVGGWDGSGESQFGEIEDHFLPVAGAIASAFVTVGAWARARASCNELVVALSSAVAAARANAAAIAVACAEARAQAEAVAVAVARAQASAAAAAQAEATARATAVQALSVITLIPCGVVEANVQAVVDVMVGCVAAARAQADAQAQAAAAALARAQAEARACTLALAEAEAEAAVTAIATALAAAQVSAQAIAGADAQARAAANAAALAIAIGGRAAYAGAVAHAFAAVSASARALAACQSLTAAFVSAQAAFRASFRFLALAEVEARFAAFIAPLLGRTILNYAALNRPVGQWVNESMGQRVSGSTSSMTRLPIDPGLTSTEPTAGQLTPTLKMAVTQDGLYQLTFDDLTDAGFDPSQADPRTLKILHRGAEVPIVVEGESDGVFDPTDVIVWYGTAIDDIYTNRNIYWLTAGGPPGLRVKLRDGRPRGTAPVPIHFPVTYHAEVNDSYWQTMPDGEGQDHYFWDDSLIAPESREFALNLDHLSPTAGPATVRVRLKGHSQDPTINPDHHTKIFINGIERDDQWWDGQITFTHDFSLPHSSLRQGRNSLRVEATGATASPVDQVFVNWMEVDYWHTYDAESDTLNFSAPEAGRFQFDVRGFRRPDIQVFDVTDPADVVLITGPTVVKTGSAYTIRFEDTARPDGRYLALTPTARRRPVDLRIDQPSSWKSPGHGADYVIITAGPFYSASLRLAQHRRASGLRVATVKVEDLYDEFNDGLFSPQAIRDFLSYAYRHWTGPAPTYVLLVGDATLDFKDNLQTGTINYVPSQIVQTDILGDTPSDNWFVCVSGDDILPDMFIGRLSAQTVPEAEAIVNKIIADDRRPPSGAWATRGLFVADDDSRLFEAIADSLVDSLPTQYVADQVYVQGYPPGDPTHAVRLVDHRLGKGYPWGGYGHQSDDSS